MPLYDYECQAGCGDFTLVSSIADRAKAVCPRCGSKGRQIPPPPGKGPAVSTFKGGWFRDLDFDPVYCETPQDLRNECDRRNLVSHQLEDSIFKTSPGPDPTPETAPELFKGGHKHHGDGV